MVLVLFSKTLSFAEKDQCRKAMLRKRSASSESIKKLGKLITPLNITASTKMKDLFGPDSWLIPKGINSKIEFLDKPAKYWEKKQSYIH